MASPLVVGLFVGWAVGLIGVGEAIELVETAGALTASVGVSSARTPSQLVSVILNLKIAKFRPRNKG